MAIIGLTIIGADYAVLLGVIFGVTNMVPYLGPVVGTIIAVSINVFTNPTRAIIILIYLVIIQTIETMIIDPKVVGSKMGLNPVLAMLAVTIGGSLFGIPGMIIGAPIMGVLKLYATRYINHSYVKLHK